MRLFNNLEFAGIDDPSTPVTKLVDVNTPVKISKRDINFWSNCFEIKNFFAYKIKNLEREEFIVAFLKFEIDHTNGRIGIKAHNIYSGVCRSRYNFILGEAARNK